MKLGRLLITGLLLMAGSMTAYAGMTAGNYSVNGVQILKMKITSWQDGKLKTDTAKTKDFAEDLNNGPLGKKQSLVALVLCPLSAMLNEGGFLLAIWDEETRDIVPLTGTAFVSISYNTGIANKKNKSSIATLAFIDFGVLHSYAALRLEYDEVKDKKNKTGGLDGLNCLNSGKSMSMAGAGDGNLGGEETVDSGNFKFGSLIDGYFVPFAP